MIIILTIRLVIRMRKRVGAPGVSDTSRGKVVVVVVVVVVVAVVVVVVVVV